MTKRKILLVLVIMLVSATTVQAAGPKITDIEVKGNNIIPEAAIIGQLETKVGAEFDREQLKQDLQTVMDLGYFSNIGVDFKPYQTGMRLIIRVTEYPLVAEVNITGNKVVKEAKLKEQLGLGTGQILNAKQLKQGIKEIEKYYQKQGYVLARVVGREVTKDGKVTLKVAEGKLNQVMIEGNERTKDFVITRELSIKPGEVINFKQLRKDIHTLRRLGYFKQVKTKFKRAKEDPTTVNLVLNVKEKPTRTLAGGLSHVAGSGLAALVEFENKNLFGEGKKFTTDLEYGPERNRYQVDYSQPWTFGRPLSLDLGVYRKLDSTPDDEEVLKRGGNVNVGYPLVNDFRGYFGLDIEQVKKNNDWKPSHSLSLTTIRNTSNRSFNPNQGSRVSFAVEKSGVFGGTDDYTKYETDFRKYFAAGESGSIATRLKLGVVGGQVPDHERFFLTGRGGVRGYKSSHYASKDSFVGDSLVVGNLEYRHQIIDKLTGLAFIDAGRSFNQEIKVDKLTELNYSLGVGFRFKTPVGQLGVDYGYAPEGESGHKTDYRITVGNKF